MPVPKKRHSNTRTNKRRANWKLSPVYSGICPQCGSPVLPYQACTNCGTYKGRTVLIIKAKKGKEEKQAKEQLKGEKKEAGKESKKEAKKEEKAKKEKK